MKLTKSRYLTLATLTVQQYLTNAEAVTEGKHAPLSISYTEEILLGPKFDHLAWFDYENVSDTQLNKVWKKVKELVNVHNTFGDNRIELSLK